LTNPKAFNPEMSGLILVRENLWFLTHLKRGTVFQKGLPFVLTQRYSLGFHLHCRNSSEFVLES
jgi:hypothetical protein